MRGQASLPSDQQEGPGQQAHTPSIGSSGVAHLGDPFHEIRGGGGRIAPTGQSNSAHAIGGAIDFQKGTGGRQGAEGVIQDHKSEALIDQNHGTHAGIQRAYDSGKVGSWHEHPGSGGSRTAGEGQQRAEESDPCGHPPSRVADPIHEGGLHVRQPIMPSQQVNRMEVPNVGADAWG